jgi:hypothetical protein
VLKEATAAAQRALRLSPHDPLAAVYCGTASYAQFVGHSLRDVRFRPDRYQIAELQQRTKRA